MFRNIMKKSKISQYTKIAKKVESLDSEMSKLSDKELMIKTSEFRNRLFNGESRDKVRIEAFAVVREATFRVLKKKHYRVQIIGGLALDDGYVAEMKTGEGKTLTELLPAYINALTGKVHIITVNDYLAKRDSDEMGRVFNFLGLTYGFINANVHPLEKQKIYKRDIVYGTSKEFGFDYLRDNMAKSKEEMVMQDLNYVIIDEVDSILIDESRTPLIISKSGEDATELYLVIDEFVKSLERGSDIEDSESYYEKMIDDLNYYDFDEEGDFRVDPKRKSVILTENGINKIEERFDFEKAGEKTTFLINHLISQSLKANYTMDLDVDYIINGKGEILIVDTFTGRSMSGRRFSDGLHQAIEAKEGVEIKKESQTIATITLQKFFSLYKKISGMTGTGETEEDEFIETYDLKVLPIPTNKPVIRDDMDDIVYLNEDDKYEAISELVINSNGRPILIGVPSINKSEELSKIFRDKGIHHRVLNAKNHELEAELISQAGRLGAVTIATNMAGRGTDIMLGGNAEGLIEAALRRMGFSNKSIRRVLYDEVIETKEDKEVQYFIDDNMPEVEEKVAKEKEKVLKLGGLLVIGTEKHESRRIDNQLRGRAGRQGDPGTSVFMISLEDDMYRDFGGEKVKSLIEKDFVKPDNYLEKGIDAGAGVRKLLDHAQVKNEEHNYSIRKNVLEYDDVMDSQRSYIYKLRNSIVKSDLDNSEEGAEVKRIFMNILNKAPEELINVVEKFSNNKKDFVKQMNFIIERTEIDVDLIDSSFSKSKLKTDLSEAFKKKYDEVLSESDGSGNRPGDLERFVLLEVIDRLWIQFLKDADSLKSSTSMASFGRTNQIDSFKEKSAELFNTLVSSIPVEVVNLLHMVKVN